MAYVPASELTAASNLLAELEVATTAAEVSTDDLESAVASALTHKTTAENALASKFDFLLLAGC
jgi:hypothetical protein